MAEDCREKIMSEDYVDFIWKSDYSVRELERLFPQYCVQILNDFYAVFYVESRILEQNRIPYSYEVFPIWRRAGLCSFWNIRCYGFGEKASLWELSIRGNLLL